MYLCSSVCSFICALGHVHLFGYLRVCFWVVQCAILLHCRGCVWHCALCGVLFLYIGGLGFLLVVITLRFLERLSFGEEKYLSL